MVNSRLCLRNRSSVNLWLYNEITAPLEWVHLRPGESCDIPSSRMGIYTIGASIDEPSRTEAILANIGFASMVIAAIFLLCLPSGAGLVGLWAGVCYVVGAVSATGGIVAGGTLLGISNESEMKRAGIQVGNGKVMDITSTLVRFDDSDGDGTEMPIYTFRWEEPPQGETWTNRHDGFTTVDIKEDRGHLERLGPTTSRVLEEIRREAGEDTAYARAIENAEIQEIEVKEFGGEGGTCWVESSFCPPADANKHNRMGDKIVGVRATACKFVDGIQLKFKGQDFWQDPCGNDNSKKQGVFHGNVEENYGYGGELLCEEDEYIEKLSIKHDKYICQINFFTNKGNTLQIGGRDGDGEHTTEIGGPGSHWIGFRMWGCKWVDKMTFLVKKCETE